MNARKSRLQRKAARVVASQVETLFDVRLGKLRRELNEALAENANEHREAIKRLNADKAEARAEAYKKYDAARDELVMEMAQREAVAA